ncbi:hypothetical protein DNX69_08965 [Rhodopseudomonas palustris]|uniref:Uncharacterized protein n=1 Tax=Rhodopseudomonas palustris TaxID=1076 RepID=A0A323UIF0_RHOPL|nr:hypothetical protein DNX69_08965 [Rhodopseudomonas palustris]
MTANDPTDEALAAIASIFEKPDAADKRDEAVSEGDSSDASQRAAESGEQPATDEVEAAETESDQPSAEHPAEAGGAAQRDAEAPEPDPVDDDLERYTREGPGPLDALRFKWRLRRDERGYYVDETIGASVHPITAGPMPRAEAIAFIESRDAETRRRFEALRNEIVMGPSERGYEEDGDEPDAER